MRKSILGVFERWLDGDRRTRAAIERYSIAPALVHLKQLYENTPLAWPSAPAIDDRLTALRRRVCPVLHRLVRCFGGYIEFEIHPAEYVGTVQRSLDRFRADLREIGFHPEPIAALKHHSDGRTSAGSWVTRKSRLAEKQLHVTLFRTNSGTVDMYSHWEASWIRHPIKHYQLRNLDADRGVATMRSVLRDHDIPFRSERARPER